MNAVRHRTGTGIDGGNPRMQALPETWRKLRIAPGVIEAIRRTAAARSRGACGLLFGCEREVTGWQRAENVAEDPERRCEIDPRALVAALRAEQAGGPRIAGYWHAHPSGDAPLAAMDPASAARDGKLWLVVAGNAVSAWQAGQRGFAAVDYRLG